MLKIAVLGSTSGTDLQAIIDALRLGSLPGVELVCVISNRKEAYILERARQAGIKAVYLPSAGIEREAYDRKIAEVLDKNGVKLLILIGYMRFNSPWFVDKYRNKVMNIHPSLLPAFAGGMDKNVHAEVLKAGVSETGCTLHFVDEGADTGPIIAQKRVSIAANETVDSLKSKVQAAEQEVILQAIAWYRDGKIQVQGTKLNILA
jgi:phosphoribosylglycinamide formyltransferase 1